MIKRDEHKNEREESAPTSGGKEGKAKKEEWRFQFVKDVRRTDRRKGAKKREREDI